MDLYQRAKRYSIEKFTATALSLLASTSAENLIRLTYLAEKIPKKESYREKIRWIRTLFQSNHLGLAIARRVLSETHPHHRKKLISNCIVNQLLVGTNRRKAFETERGFYQPDAMLISPTMRCNLNCYGCYSGVYSQEDLPYEVLDRLMGECKEMGIHLVMMTGGEPFLRQDLFDLFKKHDDMMFQIYTNATLIDEKMIDRFVALGNVAPAISLEGLREETDGSYWTPAFPDNLGFEANEAFTRWPDSAHPAACCRPRPARRRTNKARQCRAPDKRRTTGGASAGVAPRFPVRSRR